MKYLAKKFSSRASTKAYRDNFDATFGKKPKHPPRAREVIQTERCPECFMEFCDVCHDHDMPSCFHGVCEECKPSDCARCAEGEV